MVTTAAARRVESGRAVRIDSTVVAAAIHAPTDSALLYDGLRVLRRLLRRAEHLSDFTAYHAHRKRAKRRLLQIQHAAPQATALRRAAYRELVTLAQATIDYATCALVRARASGLSRHAGHARAPDAAAEAGPHSRAPRAGDRPDDAPGAPRRIGAGRREGGLALRAAH
ncbi:MAG: hypothetical protein ACREON_02035 [Gemmatimonadaceae bacterium]